MNILGLKLWKKFLYKFQEIAILKNLKKKKKKKRKIKGLEFNFWIPFEEGKKKKGKKF